MKDFVVIYILTPLIKINYLFAKLFIFLLYKFCKNEIDNLLTSDSLSQQQEQQQQEQQQPTVIALNIEEVINKIHSHAEIELMTKEEFESKNNFSDNIELKNTNEDTIDITKDIKEDIAEYLLEDGIMNDDLVEENSKKTIETNERIIKKEMNEFNKNTNANVENDMLNVDNNEKVIDNLVEHMDDKNYTINLETDFCEPVESISIEEIDFGDYMSNLIKNEIEIKEKMTTITECKLNDIKVEKPKIIKIGKKKNL